MVSNLLRIDSIRSIWDEQQQQWFYVVKDVVAFLADSVNAADYIKKLRMRDSFLSAHWDSLVLLKPIQTNSGTQNLSCTTLEGVFRITMSISSYKAELLKRWLCSLSIASVRGITNPLVPFHEWFTIVNKQVNNPKLMTKILSGKMTNEELESAIEIDPNESQNVFLNTIVQSTLDKPSAVGKQISLETFFTMVDLPLKPYIQQTSTSKIKKEPIKKEVVKRGRKPVAATTNTTETEDILLSEKKDKSKKKKKKKKK
ncbi:MAG: hypothetical protein JNL36_12270 [Candidatus Kapabacteria bacterium]|nr:hypothetical protein [Candidatus Kapabacteria bacterium]